MSTHDTNAVGVGAFHPYRNFLCRPKNKYIRITKDENFTHDQHYLSNTPAIAENVCYYDLDQIDAAWLKVLNGERNLAGLVPVTDEQFERVIEELEVCVAANESCANANRLHANWLHFFVFFFDRADAWIRSRQS